jgi:hypothetical protein
VYRALGQKDFRELPDQGRIHHRGRDGAVTQEVTLYTRRIDYLRVKVEQGFTIGEVERSVSMYLSPDEHVFGSQRYLPVSLPHVGAHGIQDLLFREVDLWV